MTTSFRSRFFALLPAAALVLGSFTGCEQKPVAPVKNAAKTGGESHEEEHGHHHHSHGEKGPHGGALVAIGEDAAHLEVTLDAETGKVTAYVLDGEAKNPVTVKHDQLELTFTKEHAHDHEHEEGEEHKHDEALPEAGSLVLLAVEPADGATSQFAGESADLKGAKEFDAVLVSITINGKEYPKVAFNYPKGNEHDHHHH